MKEIRPEQEMATKTYRSTEPSVKPYQARTELGKKLLAIKSRILAAGGTAASNEDVHQEIAVQRRYHLF